MTAGKHLPAFCVTAAVLAVLLFLFSAPYLLWMLLALLGMGALSVALLGRDARRLRLTLETSSGGTAGRPLPLHLHTGAGRFLAADQAAVELEVASVLFGVTERHHLALSLAGGSTSFEASVTAAFCGETQLRCTGVQLMDRLDLVRFRCTPFPPVRTAVYPPPAHVELLLTRRAAGPADAEGLMQNRRGSDPSEIFDIREYVPGDDVRTIHWKLSSKTDTLIVRQASDPSHYDVALLPDLCLAGQEDGPTADECNSAVAVAIAVGESLLRQGTPFCLAVPTAEGLRLWEVRSLRQLHSQLPEWLSLPASPQRGTGLRYFCTEHLEQHFTRLLVLSAGRYPQNLNGLDHRTGVTVISTDQTAETPAYTELSAACQAVVLPARPQRGETYRILC